ncbi:hypothetical protein EDEG_01493 [Edhazardia aedis USNM 41457]|uniref:J domain-containing protein n=1 Tax=Edhazardia aedis (strain USNM 41457) TaxID=1003232 RepID=J9DSC4_EDHAE|nr:hypothetical protein EDEG_01493 [Edhazardia aedis USNM 41457]|eukprot:EJW04212.1 hypothetical protein EDEG_01493 [Edhazardia aedis USNM 41457]
MKKEPFKTEKRGNLQEENALTMRIERYLKSYSILFVKLCLFVVLIYADAIDDVEMARRNLEIGDVKTAEKEFVVLFNSNREDLIVQKGYFDFLYITGSYNRLISNFDNFYKQLDLPEKLRENTQSMNFQSLKELRAKAVDCSTKMENFQKDYKRNGHNIKYLYKESPYSKLIGIKYCRYLLENKELKECEEAINNLTYLFPSSDDLIEIKYQLYCMIGLIDEGVSGLISMAPKSSVYNLKYLYNIYKDLESRYNSSNTGYNSNVNAHFFKEYSRLNEQCNSYMSKDSFVPSIFYHMKYLILSKVVLLGCRLGQKNLGKLAHELKTYKEEDLEKFLYLQCMVLDEDLHGVNNARAMTAFKDKTYMEQIDALIGQLKARKQKEENDAKEREREENERRKRNNERRKQRESQYQQKSKKRISDDYDPKGYYEVLESKPTDSAKVLKKNRNRLLRKYDTDKTWKRPEDKERASEMCSAIHQAYRVLGDPKKRELYDSGMLEDNMYGGNQQYENYAYQNDNIADIFKMFNADIDLGQFFNARNGNAKFTVFSESFNSGNNRGGKRRTRYVFTGPGR